MYVERIEFILARQAHYLVQKQQQKVSYNNHSEILTQKIEAKIFGPTSVDI